MKRFCEKVVKVFSKTLISLICQFMDRLAGILHLVLSCAKSNGHVALLESCRLHLEDIVFNYINNFIYYLVLSVYCFRLFLKLFTLD